MAATKTPIQPVSLSNLEKGRKKGLPRPKPKKPPPLSQTFIDLQWVREHLFDEVPGTAFQEAMRRQYKEDLRGFNEVYAKHERENRAARQAQSAGPTSPEPSLKDSNQLDRPTGEVDEGSERCLALVERLLVERAWEK